MKGDYNRHLRNRDYFVSAADKEKAETGMPMGTEPDGAGRGDGANPAFPRASHYHTYTCTDCKIVIACQCLTPARHQERAEHGWDDRCDKCERKAQADWFKWLNTYPEGRIFDPSR